MCVVPHIGLHLFSSFIWLHLPVNFYSDNEFLKSQSNVAWWNCISLLFPNIWSRSHMFLLCVLCVAQFACLIYHKVEILGFYVLLHSCNFFFMYFFFLITPKHFVFSVLFACPSVLAGFHPVMNEGVSWIREPEEMISPLIPY